MTRFASCARVRPHLLDLVMGSVTGSRRRAMEQHVESCERCHAFLTQLTRSADALARAEPPPVSSEVRQRHIAHAVAQAAITSPKRTWRLTGALAGACAIAAGVIVAALVLTEPEAKPSMALVEGSLLVGRQRIQVGQSPAYNHVLQTGPEEEASVELDDGSRVRIGKDTRTVVLHFRGRRWRLEKGWLECKIEPQTRENRFAVETPDADVEVVGTVFLIHFTLSSGTSVSVDSGTVRVTHRETGGRKELGPGQNWKSRSTATPEPEEAKEPSAREIAPGKAPAITDQIRGQIREGQLEAAREAIARIRVRARGQRRVLAELAILEAEALLAERLFARAIVAYLDVTQAFPATTQAETALFAAAQIALDNDEAGYSARDLLLQYRRRYPEGRFRDEVERGLTDVK